MLAGLVAYVRTSGGSRTALTWTPDGQALVFVGRRGGTQQLYVRQLDADEATPIDGTEDAQLPAVSPDGDWVAFWARGTIKKVRIGGGPVMDVKSDVASLPFGLVYDGRGYLYFGQIDGGIGEISVDGRFVLVTTLREGEVGHNSPWPLPDGRTLLYTVRKRSRSWGGEEIVAQNLATGDRSVLLKDAADARYVSTGHLVFLRLGTLFAVPFDAGRVEIRGAPVPVLGGVAQSLTAPGVWDVTGAGQLAVAATTGTLAWIPGPVVPNDEAALVTVDRRGQASPLSAPPRSYNGALRLSPDGRRLAVTIKSLTEVGLWVVDIAGGTLTPLTLDGEVYWPLWSPDGSRLVFQWLKDGRWSLAAQPLDRTAAPEILLANREVDPSSFTRDGRLAGHEAGDIVLVTVGDGKTSVDTLVQTSKEDLAPAVSRDGGWLAYTSSVSGQREIYVRPYPGPGETKQVWSRMGGMDPAWHPNGREMFFVADVEKEWTLLMMAVDVAPGSPLRIGTPRQLFEFDPRVLWFVGGLVRNYDVALDGQRFYVMQARNPPPPPVVTHINLIQNWFEELKAKVPVR